MCSLRDRWEELGERARVLGISYDAPSALAKFRQGHNLPFPLLSDEDKAVAKAYGVAGMLAAARVSFVIGSDGVITAVIPEANTGGHAEEVLEALPKQQA
jgi:thioredoxin-dependent peroxiredoxin